MALPGHFDPSLAIFICIMSDAHIPNSHPDVTPGWEPYEFPRTGLPEAIRTNPVEGSDGNRYSGNVPFAWCTTGRLPKDCPGRWLTGASGKDMVCPWRVLCGFVDDNGASVQPGETSKACAY